MPSPSYIPAPQNESPLGDILSSFVTKNNQNVREQKETDAISEIIERHKQDGQNIQGRLDSIISDQRLGPTKKTELVKQTMEMAKYNTELQKKAQAEADKEKKKENNKAQLRYIEKKYGLEPGSGDAYEDNPSAFAQVAKPDKAVNTPKGPKEKYEETIAVENAKEVPKLEQSIAKGSDILSNIKTIEDLATNNLSGIPGYVKAGFNTEAAAQLTTLGATNLDTVIKLFNPAGTLPTAKLNWIRDTFSVSPWENLSTIKGKLNTQKIIANQSIARAKERLALIKKYHGNIPDNVEQKFDEDTSSLLDVLEEQYSPEKKSGRPGFVKIKDPQGVERWVPEKIAQQLQG